MRQLFSLIIFLLASSQFSFGQDSLKTYKANVSKMWRDTTVKQTEVYGRIEMVNFHTKFTIDMEGTPTNWELVVIEIENRVTSVTLLNSASDTAFQCYNMSEEKKDKYIGLDEGFNLNKVGGMGIAIERTGVGYFLSGIVVTGAGKFESYELSYKK